MTPAFMAAVCPTCGTECDAHCDSATCGWGRCLGCGIVFDGKGRSIPWSTGKDI